VAAQQYDFIIIGGGSAGSALANRLSADPANRVLVLEAGRPDYIWDVFIHMPAALTFPIGSRLYDWRYESEPEPFMGGRRIYHARGKVLGGSSSINGMIFQRGNPLDYERWAADPGMGSWDYAHCLPYFKKMENCLAGGDEYRGTDGPLILERGPATNPLFRAFFKAAQQAGYSLTKDVNGYRQEGFAPFDRNISRGRRLSAARAYLHPVMRRPNLTVQCRAFVTRILFEGGRAVGVEFRRGWGAGNRGRGAETERRTRAAGTAGQGRGAETTQRARAGEVILCGGAINSPQLLQLSGVGPADLLGELGIEPVADLPGVGANLQDHLEVYVQYASKLPVSVSPALKWRNRPAVGARWLFRRSGPGATNHFEGGGFARSNDEVRYPNLMFHFLPIAIRYDGSAPAGDHGYQVHIGPMYSDSRGSVRIVSADPSVHPALRFNYLSTATDRREWIEAIRIARRILTQPAFSAYNAGELSPGNGVQTDEQILDWVARDGETALHPSCTAAMGTGDMSAVDPATMRVHGLEGLRVVDASVMPYITNGNIYAPVMMIAEKAADLILGNTALPPSAAGFYRGDAPAQGAPAPGAPAGRPDAGLPPGRPPGRPDQ
jgi:choline dehydrogenase